MQRFCYIICSATLFAAMVLAPKSATTFMALISIVSVFSVWRNGTLGACMIKLLKQPVTLLLLMLGGLIVLSSTWHFSGDLRIIEALNRPMVLVTGLLGMLWWQSFESPDGNRMFDHEDIGVGVLIGYGVGLLGAVVGYVHVLLTGDALWGHYLSDPLTPMNNSAVMLSLFIWPILIFARRISNVMAILIMGVVAVILSLLSSAAALFALLLGVFVISFIYFFAKRLLLGGICVAVLLVASAPMIIKHTGVGSLMSHYEVYDGSSIIASSAQHRLAMWSFVADRIAEKPWLGWGFGASRTIPQEGYRLGLDTEIMPLHPHNLSLQTRLELGVPGIFIVVALMLSVLVPLLNLCYRSSFGVAAFVSAVSWIFIANVSFGMWQTWWISTAFVLASVVRLAAFTRHNSTENNSS